MPQSRGGGSLRSRHREPQPRISIFRIEYFLTDAEGQMRCGNFRQEHSGFVMTFTEAIDYAAVEFGVDKESVVIQRMTRIEGSER